MQYNDLRDSRLEIAYDYNCGKLTEQEAVERLIRWGKLDLDSAISYLGINPEFKEEYIHPIKPINEYKEMIRQKYGDERDI